MALTATQVLNLKLMMGYSALTTVFDWRLDPLSVNVLSAVEEAEVIAILTEFDCIKYDADKLNARGLDSAPRRTHLKLGERMGLIFGVPPAMGSNRLYRG